MTLGVVFALVALQLLWLSAQHSEQRYRRWKKTSNSKLKAAGSHTPFATHTPRKLTWTAPSVLSPVFWVCAAILTVATLVYIPRLPDLMPNPLRTFTSSTSGVHLPPTLEFNPPQWFDPPHRDQVYWLENVARAVSHSTRVSWQVITSKFPMSPPFLASHSQSFDSPTSPPFPGYDAWHTMSSWHSTTSAEDLHLDPVVTSLHMPKSSALPTSPASTKNTKVTSINDNNDSKFDNATAVALWTPQGSPHSVSTCPRELPTAVALWRPGRVFTGIGSLLTVPSLSTTVAVWRQEQAFNDSGTLPKIALPSTSVALWRQERACPYIGTCLALASPTTTMAVWRSEQAFTGIGSLLAAWIPKQAPTDLDPFLTDALLCTAVTVWRSEQALTVMGTCPAYDMPTDVQFVNSTATLGDPAGLSPSIERLPFSTGGSTAVNIVLRQHPAHSIYFVNAIESASAGFISIGVQRNSALGLEFAAKTNTQQHVVRYKLGPNIPQKNVNRRDNSAHTTPRFISASGTSRISSSYSLPGNVSVTKPGLLSNISAGMQSRHTKQKCKHMHLSCQCSTNNCAVAFVPEQLASF